MSGRFPEQPLPGRGGLVAPRGLAPARPPHRALVAASKERPSLPLGTSARGVLRIGSGTTCHLICRTDQTGRLTPSPVGSELSTRIPSSLA